MTLPRIRLVARFGGGRRASPATRFVGISAAVHVVFAIVVVLFPSLRPRSRPIEDFIVVTAVGGLPPAAAPAEVTPPAPQPEPVPPEPEPEPSEQVRVETKVPEKKPPPEPEKKPPEKPAAAKPERPPPTTEAPATASPAPGEAGPVGTAAGSSIESVDFEDIEFAWYRDRVVAALKSHWRQPVLDGVTEPLSVTVTFQVLRDGSVRSPEILGTSGVRSLDRSALRAVVESDPLPPLPPNWREPLMTARFVFTWYPQ